ncbi:hypothetical protein GCM10027167_68780 [Nocardia heshunensis]
MIEAAPKALRLSELPADSTGMLQVIAYFDAFTESAANADTIIRAAALLTECPVGAIWPPRHGDPLRRRRSPTARHRHTRPRERSGARRMAGAPGRTSAG